MDAIVLVADQEREVQIGKLFELLVDILLILIDPILKGLYRLFI